MKVFGIIISKNEELTSLLVSPTVEELSKKCKCKILENFKFQYKWNDINKNTTIELYGSKIGQLYNINNYFKKENLELYGNIILIKYTLNNNVKTYINLSIENWNEFIRIKKIENSIEHIQLDKENNEEDIVEEEDEEDEENEDEDNGDEEDDEEIAEEEDEEEDNNIDQFNINEINNIIKDTECILLPKTIKHNFYVLLKKEEYI